MEGRHDVKAPPADLPLMPSPARPHNAFAQTQNLLRRDSAESEENLRAGERRMPLQKRTALRLLLLRRGAVAGRTPRHDIGDIDILAARQADSGEHLIQEPSAAPDKGKPLRVFFRARTLADQHDPRFRHAVREDQIARRIFQAAALIGFQRDPQRLKILRRGGEAFGFVNLRALLFHRRACDDWGDLCRRGVLTRSVLTRSVLTRRRRVLTRRLLTRRRQRGVLTRRLLRRGGLRLLPAALLIIADGALAGHVPQARHRIGEEEASRGAFFRILFHDRASARRPFRKT